MPTNKQVALVYNASVFFRRCVRWNKLSPHIRQKKKSIVRIMTWAFCIYVDCWYRLLLDGQLSSFLQGIAVLNMSYGNRERRTCMVAIEGEIMQRSRRRHKSQEPRNMLHNLQMRTHDGGGRDTAPLGQLQCQLATNDLDIDPTSRIQLLFGGVIIRTTQQNH